MDAFTTKHLAAWIEAQFREEERATVSELITQFVTEYPDLLDRLSWWEIYDLARRKL